MLGSRLWLLVVWTVTGLRFELLLIECAVGALGLPAPASFGAAHRYEQIPQIAAFSVPVSFRLVTAFVTQFC